MDSVGHRSCSQAVLILSSGHDSMTVFWYNAGNVPFNMGSEERNVSTGLEPGLLVKHEKREHTVSNL